MRRLTILLAALGLLLAMTGSSQADLITNLLGYWCLDETDSPLTTAADSSGANPVEYTGTINGDPTGGATGKVGTAFNFDGAGDYVSIPGPGGAELPIINTSFSTSFWTKRHDTGERFVLGMGDNGDTRGSLHIGFRDADTFTFAFWADDLNYDNAGVIGDTANYHHWVCVYDSGAVSGTKQQILYLDGAEVDREGTSGDFVGSGSNDFWIGRRRDGKDYNGLVDEVGVWNRILTQDDVDILFYKGNKGLDYYTSEDTYIWDDEDVANHLWTNLTNWNVAVAPDPPADPTALPSVNDPVIIPLGLAEVTGDQNAQSVDIQAADGGSFGTLAVGQDNLIAAAGTLTVAETVTVGADGASIGALTVTNLGTLNVAEEIAVAGGTMTVDGTLSAGAVRISAGQVNLNTGATVDIPEVEVAGGALIAADDLEVDSMTLTSGMATFGGDLDVNDAFLLNGMNLDTAAVTGDLITDGASITVDTGSTLTVHDNIDAAGLFLSGTGKLETSGTVELTPGKPIDPDPDCTIHVLDGSLTLTASPVSFLHDDFNDNSIDLAKWNVVLAGIPQDPKSVTETGERIRLEGRGHMNSVEQFDPGAPGAEGLKITGTWEMGNADMLQILTRSDGTPGGSYGETNNGIEMHADTTGQGVRIQARGGASITGGAQVALPNGTGAGRTFYFEFTDDGTNLSATLTEVGNPSNTATTTATSTSVMGTNLITFHNRETGRVAYLDDVLVEPLMGGLFGHLVLGPDAQFINLGEPISFNNVTGGTTGVTDISSDIEIRGAVSPGNSTGTLEINGSLTMGAASAYNWELGNGVQDLIHVSGVSSELTIEDGWTLNLFDDGASATDYRNQFDLFTVDTGAGASIVSVGNVATIDAGATGWDVTYARIDSDADSVYVQGVIVATKAGDLTRVGAGTQDWTDAAGEWGVAAYPTIANGAIIDSALTVNVNSAEEAFDLTLDNGGSLVVKSGASMNVLSSTTIGDTGTGGFLMVEDTATFDTLAFTTAGTIDFQGTSELTVIGDMTISDGTTTLAAGVTVDVRATIYANGGQLDANGADLGTTTMVIDGAAVASTSNLDLGNTTLTSGSIAATTTLNATDLVANGGTVNATEITIDPGNLSVGGTTVASSGPVAVAGDVAVTAGSLTADGALSAASLNVDATVNAKTGGTITGALTVNSGANLNLTGVPASPLSAATATLSGANMDFNNTGLATTAGDLILEGGVLTSNGEVTFAVAGGAMKISAKPVLNVVSGTLTIPAEGGGAMPAGMLYHLDAAVGVTKDGSNNVSGWGDLGAAHNDFSQGNAANQPIWVASSIGGLPALSFEGSDDHLDLSTATYPQTFFAVTRADTGGGLRGVWGSSNPADKGVRLQDNNWYRSAGHNTDGNDFANGDVDGVRVNGGTASYTLGAPHIVNALRGPSFNATTFNVTHVGGYYGGRYWDGDVSELIAFDRLLTEDELNDVGGYLADKYGLTTSYTGSLGTTFGPVDMAAGTTLKLNADGSGGANFQSITAGDGATINGYATALGAVNSGGSPGTLNVVGGFVMEEGSTYNWELDATPANDLIAVSGELELVDGWNLVLTDAGGTPMPGEAKQLFTYTPGELTGGDALKSTVTNVNIAQVPAWGDAIVRYDDVAGEVYMQVVEDLVWDTDATDAWNTANWNRTPVAPPAGFERMTINNADAVVNVAQDNANTTNGTPAMRVDLIAGRLDIDDLPAVVTLDVVSDPNVPGSGVVNVAGGAELNVNGNLNADVLNTAGDTTFAAGSGGTIPTVNVTGGTTSMATPSVTTLNVSAGTLTASGEQTLSSVATLNVSEDTAVPTVVNSAGVLSPGAVSLSGGTVNTAGANVTNDLAISGGVFTTAGAEPDVDVGGSLVFSGGTLVLDGTGHAAKEVNVSVVGEVNVSNSPNISVVGATTLASLEVPVSLPKGTLGYWNFNDGTANDSSGNNYHGVAVGTPTYDTDVPPGFGGKSINFNGGDNGIAVVTGGGENVFDLDQMTISFWAKEWPDGNWEPYVSKKGEGSEGYQVRRNSDSVTNMSFTLRGPSGSDDWNQDVNGDSSFNNWVHIVATYDGVTRKLYKNGLWAGEQASAGAVGDTGEELTFGCRDDNGYKSFSTVKMDEIVIIDHAVDADQVWNLYITADPRTATFGTLTMDAGSSLELTGGDTAKFGSIVAGDLCTINGDMTLLQTLTPADGTIGTLNVNGNFVTGEGSTYICDLSPTPANDLVNVSGVLDVTANWDVQLSLSGAPAGGTHVYTIFDATTVKDGAIGTVVAAPDPDCPYADLIESASASIHVETVRLMVDTITSQTWTGDTVDPEWDGNDADWVSGNAPTDGQGAIVPGGKPTATVDATGAVAHTLIVDAGTVNVTTGGDLTVSNNLWVINNGTFSADDGTVGATSVNVQATGTLEVTGTAALNTTVLNTAGDTTLTSSAGTIGTINVTGGTTNVSSPTIANVHVTGGVLTAGGVLSVENMAVVALGVVNASAFPVQVSSTLDLGGVTYNVAAGGSFQAAGADLLANLDTLTLKGGLVTIAGATDLSTTGVAVDADSGISTNEHLQLGDLTINGNNRTFAINGIGATFQSTTFVGSPFTVNIGGTGTALLTSTAGVDAGGAEEINMVGGGEVVLSKATSNLAPAFPMFRVEGGGTLTIGLPGALGSANIRIDSPGGGAVLLSSQEADEIRYDNDVTITTVAASGETAAIIAGKSDMAGGVTGSPIVTLGGSTKTFSIALGSALTLGSTDGYTLRVASDIDNGGGALAVEQGTVQLEGVTAVTSFEVSGGNVGIKAPLSAAALEVSGGTMATTAAAPITADAVEVSGTGAVSLDADMAVSTNITVRNNLMEAGGNVVEVTESGTMTFGEIPNIQGQTILTATAGTFQATGDIGTGGAETIILGGVDSELTVHSLGNPSFSVVSVGDDTNPNFTAGGSLLPDHDAGSYTVTGGGNDIWGKSDGCYFAYQEFDVNQAFDITARVGVGGFVGGTNVWRKAGLMVRDSVASESRNAATVIAADDPNGINPQMRRQDNVDTFGGDTNPANANNIGMRVAHGEPVYLRLVYGGDGVSFDYYWSDDPVGSGWNLLNDPAWDTAGNVVSPTVLTTAMTDTIYVGLAVTSHNITQQTTTTFDNLTGFVGTGTAPTRFENITGEGTIDGDIIIGGEMIPGSSLGEIEVTGNVAFADNSALHIEVRGASNDSLTVLGDITLDATTDLVLNWIPGGDGDSGSEFGGTYEILEYSGTLNGTFDEVTSNIGLPYFGGVANIADAIDYGDGTDDVISLILWDLVAGDVNLDGIVNSSDFTVMAENWQDPDLIWTEGNVNFDNIVNSSDFTVMADNWQQGPVAPLGPAPPALVMVTSVPEPSGFVLALLGLLGIGGAYCAGRRKRATADRS